MTKTSVRIGARLGLGAAIILGAASTAMAQEPPYPTFSSSVDTSTFYIYTQNESSDDTQHAFASVSPTMTLEWWDNAFLSSTFKITDYQPSGQDSFFQHEDLAIDDINFFVTDWTWSGQVGKTTVPFGLAPSNAPGLFGSNFVEDYDFGGRIMVLGGYDFAQVLADGTAGSHNLVVGSFFVDTTFMSATAFGEVDRTRKGDGGPGNTESFDSFFVTYDASSVPVLPGGINYRLSYIYNAAGIGDTGHEEGYSVGAVVPVPLAGRSALESASGEYIAINIVGEYAHFNNFGGVSGVDQDYLTGGFEVVDGQWFATATTTTRWIDDPTNGNETDHLYALSAGYNVNAAMSFQLGYAYQEITSASSHMVGLQFSYNFNVTDYQSWWPNFGKPAYVLTNDQLLKNYRQD